MVPYLMDDDVRHELFEADARRVPFGEDRPAIERDPLGEHARMLNALPIEGNAFVKPAKLHRMAQSEAPRGVGIGHLLDEQHDIVEAVRERRRQAVERPARDRLDFGGA